MGIGYPIWMRIARVWVLIFLFGVFWSSIGIIDTFDWKQIIQISFYCFLLSTSYFSLFTKRATRGHPRKYVSLLVRLEKDSSRVRSGGGRDISYQVQLSRPHVPLFLILLLWSLSGYYLVYRRGEHRCRHAQKQFWGRQYFHDRHRDFLVARAQILRGGDYSSHSMWNLSSHAWWFILLLPSLEYPRWHRSPIHDVLHQLSLLEKDAQHWAYVIYCSAEGCLVSGDWNSYRVSQELFLCLGKIVSNGEKKICSHFL